MRAGHWPSPLEGANKTYLDVEELFVILPEVEKASLLPKLSFLIYSLTK